MSAPEILHRLLQEADQVGASDVHLQMDSSGAQVRFRLDGVLVPVRVLESGLAERVFGRIKYLARLKTYQESLPQDGRIDRADSGLAKEVRVATYPTVTGEKIVLRLFHSAEVKGLEGLGLPSGVMSDLLRVLRSTQGLVLLTGPAGSGKTTTIYGCLRFLSDLGGRHIITVEDPVEQILPGLMQTEVNEARGLTFPVAARHLLRQDPQVLVIGEIRDEETASLAVRASLTGHLVISTLHAGSCRGVFERLEVMCRDRFAMLSAISLVLNQRLLRRLCPDCHGRACPSCLQTGYKGRIALVERVQVEDSLRQKLRDSGPESVQPSQTLQEAAREVVAAGLSDQRECERVLGAL